MFFLQLKRMANKVGTDEDAKGKKGLNLFDREGGNTVGVRRITFRFLAKFTGYVSLLQRSLA